MCIYKERETKSMEDLKRMLKIQEQNNKNKKEILKKKADRLAKQAVGLRKEI